MNIQQRIVETEQLFNEKQEQRKQHLDKAQELLVELHKLQGQHEVLKQLESDTNAAKEATKEPEEATIINAKPAKEK